MTNGVFILVEEIKGLEKERGGKRQYLKTKVTWSRGSSKNVLMKILNKNNEVEHKCLKTNRIIKWFDKNKYHVHA